MRFEQHDSVESSDPHTLLFGPDDQGYADEAAPLDLGAGPDAGSRRERTRRAHRARRRRRRRRRTAVLVSFLAAVIVAAAGWFVIRPIVEDRFSPKDWSGPGTGQVLVEVQPNDTAAAIGATLVKQGVVRTKRAFTNAASDNEDSRSIQPGFYRLRKHMSAKQALALLLDPASKVASKVTIPEGMIERDILVRLAKAIRVPLSTMRSAAAKVGGLGLPEGYTAGSAAPKSAEGFLFPDTYSFDPGTTATEALQQMTSEFTAVDRDMGFADAANERKVGPYRALIIASMIEGEAKFPDDRAKVARVVYNRLDRKMPLGVDATSIYGAKIAGQDPSKVDYDKPAPYNTRLTPGLPPTPIGNPGRAALTAAVNPAAGDWLYYVNGDAAGHLYFATSESDFQAAVQRCQQNHWGCT